MIFNQQLQYAHSCSQAVYTLSDESGNRSDIPTDNYTMIMIITKFNEIIRWEFEDSD